MAGDADIPSLYRPRFLFDIPTRPLLSIANWENGLAFKDIDFSDDGGLPVVKIAEVKSGLGPETKYTRAEYNERALLSDGDLLFCWSGSPETSIGTFRWWNGPAWLNQHIFKVTPKEGITADFLRHLLLYLQPNLVQIAKNKQTTGLGHVTKADLRDIKVQVPDPSVQAAISNLLTPIDDKIELNRRLAVTLEDMVRALFKSWFVDFDPVYAKAEGRDTGLPTETASLFPSRIGDDGLPDGWQQTTLATFADLNPENRSSTTDQIIAYVDLANTKRGVIESVQYFTSQDAPSRAQRALRVGDTIVGTVRPANASYALIGEDKLTGSTGFAVLRPKSADLREYVYLAATSRENVDALAGLADGGAYPAVRPSVVAETPCCRAPESILEAFSAAASSLVDRIEAARKQSSKLVSLRDTLLPKVISGELRIKDSESAMEVA